MVTAAYLVCDAPVAPAAKKTIQNTLVSSTVSHLALSDLLDALSRTVDYLATTKGCVANTEEAEVSYPYVIVLQGVDSMVPGLIRARFRYLNPLVVSFQEIGSLQGQLQELIPKVESIGGVMSSRIGRMRAWIGFNDDELCAEFNSMTNQMAKTELDLETALKYRDYMAEKVDHRRLLSLPKEDAFYKQAYSQWDFPAHMLSVDELLYCGYLILKPLYLQCLGNTGTDTDTDTDAAPKRLLAFLFYIRDSYRIGNPFHNFRHAIDVLQATNYFLNRLQQSQFEVTFTASETFALLLAALGHDLGHPATTNMTLTANNAPISAVFNNQSVLENFHQIQFRRASAPFLWEWRNLLSDHDYDAVQELICKSILATDMAKHDQYVAEIGKFTAYPDRASRLQMLAALVIKSADISNVCRPLNTSVKWALSLGEEFKQGDQLQSVLEGHSSVLDTVPPPFVIKQMTPESALKAVPTISSSQNYFISRFAKDFFTKVGHDIPPLNFLAEELDANDKYWKANIA